MLPIFCFAGHPKSETDKCEPSRYWFSRHKYIFHRKHAPPNENNSCTVSTQPQASTPTYKDEPYFTTPFNSNSWKQNRTNGSCSKCKHNYFFCCPSESLHARRERPNYHRLIFNPEPFSPTIDGSSFLILRARLLPLFLTISNSFRLLGLVIRDGR
jgi:hypothetical protein